MQGLQVTDQKEITRGVFPSTREEALIFSPERVSTETEGSWAKARVCRQQSKAKNKKNLFIYIRLIVQIYGKIQGLTDKKFVFYYKIITFAALQR